MVTRQASKLSVLFPVLTAKRAYDGSSLADGLPGTSPLPETRRSSSEQDADCHFVYFLPVMNQLPHLARLLSRASSRKRRCTYISSLNTCKECISKDVKCSLSELSSNTTDKQRVARRALLPLQQSSTVLHGLHEGPASSPISIYDAPSHEVCTELVALYLDLIHDKQHILFHPPTFIAEYHAGQVPEFLVWGMAALASR